MDRGAWQDAVHGLPKSWTWLFTLFNLYTEWKWKLLSHVRLFVTPWIIQSMVFSRPNSGVGSLSLLQGIFPTQGLNPGLPHCRQILYQLSHKKSCEMPGRWIINWNQDCWEKYQQLCICRWYHSNGRKWRGTKEPLNDGERGEWKSSFKKLRPWHLVCSLHGNSGRFYLLGLQNHWGWWMQPWN